MKEALRAFLGRQNANCEEVGFRVRGFPTEREPGGELAQLPFDGADAAVQATNAAGRARAACPAVPATSHSSIPSDRAVTWVFLALQLLRL